MARPVITVQNLGKRYTLGNPLEHNTLRDHIAHAAGSLANVLRGRRREKPERKEFWALRDLNFEVFEGQALGIIGHNGAGKSTLLKILSQITEPTLGEVRLKGRVASLLEVGTGFHPELSGRENIFMNGAILGMTRREIQSKFDEIVAFAEVDEFVDTPVKRYSSGMYVRLAFAVAAHLEPEILLVDEVLAVGDATFQKKCLSKMGDVARGGKTVLFVSHSMLAMQTLCDRIVWLDHGSVKQDGPASEVITSYLHLLSSTSTQREWSLEDAPGDERVKLRRACVRPRDKAPGEPITVGTPTLIEFEYSNLTPAAKLHLSLHVLDEQGMYVFCTNTVREPNWHGRTFPSGLYRSVCLIPANLLNDGTFRLRLLIVMDGNVVLSKHEDILIFDVLDDDPAMRAGWYGKWPGVVRPRLDWRTESLGGQDQDTAAPLHPSSISIS